MTRRSEQIDRIEASLSRIEEALAGHAGILRDQIAASRADAVDLLARLDQVSAKLDLTLRAALPGDPVSAAAAATDPALAPRRTAKPAPAAPKDKM